MLLALGAIMTGCTDDRQPAAGSTPTTAGQQSASSSQSGAPSDKKDPTPRVTSVETGGLTIRYLDKDGTIKTVRVEDFRK